MECSPLRWTTNCIHGVVPEQKQNQRIPYDSEGFTHSDIGFPLTQLPGERKAMERKGEKVGALEKFNVLFTCLQNRAAAESGGRKTPGGGNLFVGRYHGQPP